MSHVVLHVPGDGIGPEVTWAARRVLDATGVAIDWVQAEAGEAAHRETGSALPESTRRLLDEIDVVLKGPMGNPAIRGYASPNIAMRQAAGLFANVRIARALPGVPTHHPAADIVLVREITEDLYCGPQQMIGPDAAIGVKYVTRAATHRVARFACELARRAGRERITVAHKGGTLKATDGLFLEAATEAAAEYRDVVCDDVLVDALTMYLVRDAAAFDMLLAPFQYGDILADLTAGLVGGLGVAPGASYGDRAAFFEAAHGNALKHAGKDRVNPTALILSGALLLDHLGEDERAARVRAATEAVLAAGEATTYDVGGSASTTEMTDAIIAALGIL